jgi:parvulin-like peptidyl-prolyl isomerase
VAAKSGQTNKSGAGRTKKLSGRNRLALIVFGALFAALFAGFAIAQGIGQPSVPAGDVAIVQNVPSDIGSVSEAEFKRAMVQQAAQGKLKKTPAPGSEKFEELKKKALGELIDYIWISGEAEEFGISVTPKQVETELAQIKKTNFPTEPKYQEFLKTSHFTQEDVDKRVELQLLVTQIQELVGAAAPAPSNSEIADFYNASKATYTTKPTRDVRIVTNKDKAKVDQALKLLEKDDSAASWEKVAAKYSSDPTTKTKGGLQPGLSEELLASAGPLKSAIFNAATGELLGPINYQGNYLVLEVEKLNPEKVKTLGEVRSEISTQLGEQAKQEHLSEFVSEYQSKWTSRTFCASGYVIERCANYKGPGHPSTAPAACYEANPKVPAKECPAPVTMNAPALPGTVTILKPTGERLVQRPLPEASKETSGKEAEALPEGTAPEPGK